MVADPGHVEGGLQAVLVAGGAVHPVQTGLSHPSLVEGVFPDCRVEVAEYISVKFWRMSLRVGAHFVNSHL